MDQKIRPFLPPTAACPLIPAKNPLEMAARPPLEAEKKLFFARYLARIRAR